MTAPQRAETKRRLPKLPIQRELIGDAIARGEVPNPCYLFWADTCLIKVYNDGLTHADVQAYNLTQSQSPSDFTAFIYNGAADENYMTVSREVELVENQDVEGLVNFGISDVRLVDNSEDWFPRLQYYFK